MGMACRTHGRYEKFTQNVGRKNLKGRDNSEDLGVDGRRRLEWILGETE
jgi:hypothetical protein